MQRKKRNRWTLGRVIPWEMRPPLSRKATCGVWAGGCANRHPFPENLCAHPSVDQGQKPKPNWNSFLHILHGMWDKLNKNRNAWKPGNRECTSCTPPKCESRGCPKTCSAFAFLHLHYMFFIFEFYLFCIAFLHLHFLCIYDFHFFALFFCPCFLFEF